MALDERSVLRILQGQCHLQVPDGGTTWEPQAKRSGILIHAARLGRILDMGHNAHSVFLDPYNDSLLSVSARDYSLQAGLPIQSDRTRYLPRVDNHFRHKH